MKRFCHRALVARAGLGSRKASVMSRFRVWFMCNGPYCTPLYVSPEDGSLWEKDAAESIHPYFITDGVVCHHCTPKRAYARAKRLIEKITGKRARVTRNWRRLHKVVPNPRASRRR